MLLVYELNCQVLTEDCDLCLHILCDGNHGKLLSGSHSIHEPMRKGTQSFQVSSSLSPWLKHSTLHTEHCAHELHRVGHSHMSDTLHHIGRHDFLVHHLCNSNSLGHQGGRDSLLHLHFVCTSFQQLFLHRRVVFQK